MAKKDNNKLAKAQQDTISLISGNFALAMERSDASSQFLALKDVQDDIAAALKKFDNQKKSKAEERSHSGFKWGVIGAGASIVFLHVAFLPAIAVGFGVSGIHRLTQKKAAKADAARYAELEQQLNALDTSVSDRISALLENNMDEISKSAGFEALVRKDPKISAIFAAHALKKGLPAPKTDKPNHDGPKDLKL